MNNITVHNSNMNIYQKKIYCKVSPTKLFFDLILLLVILPISTRIFADVSVSVVPKINTIINASKLIDNGFEGQKITIGVISNGAVNHHNLQIAGILPSDTYFASAIGEGDEGDWMLQIVHDIAPQSKLAFCSSLSPSQTVKCAKQLIINNHANIIVYDTNPQPIYWYPTFQEIGLSNLAKNNPNVLFFTGAGNNGGGYYQGHWIPQRLTLNGVKYIAQNFGKSVKRRSSPFNRFPIPPHHQSIILMSENISPNEIATHGSVQILLVNADEKILKSGNPRLSVQELNYRNTTNHTIWMRIALVNKSTQMPSHSLAFKMVTIEGGIGVTALPLEYSTSGGAGNSAYGLHNIISVAAIDPNSYYHGQYVTEAFANSGPQCIDFDWYGSHMHKIQHQKCFKQPVFMAPDRTLVAMPSSQGSGYTFRPFVGDSAAAPVAGAAAALLMSAHLSASMVVHLLKITAFHPVTKRNWPSKEGYGVINVDGAAAHADLLKNTTLDLLSATLQPHESKATHSSFARCRMWALGAQKGSLGMRNHLVSLAKKGDVWAMAWYGWYELQAHHYHQSAMWLWTASQRGNSFAESLLGSSFNRGWGVAPDPRAAFAWWLRAGSQGNATALYNLATLYATGRGAEYAPQRAYTLMAASMMLGYSRPWMDTAFSHLKRTLTFRARLASKHFARQVAKDPALIVGNDFY